MSWIEQIEPARAEGELKDLYRELEAARGKVSNILQVHSLRPGALKTHLDFYMQLMFAPGGLSRALPDPDERERNPYDTDAYNGEIRAGSFGARMLACDPKPCGGSGHFEGEAYIEFTIQTPGDSIFNDVFEQP